MKIDRIVCLGLAIALSLPALAELPLSGETLGKVQGMLDFCAQRNPQDATKYQEQASLLVRDVPEEEVVKVRDSAEYKASYDSVSVELGDVAKQNATAACNGFLEEFK